ncbi:MBL fold hydrolase [soil metagenome]
MIFKRIYDEQLSQASYLIGCGATGEAIVIDPNRDAQQYIRIAGSEKLTITHVTETHIHADFVSGARELASRTGARLYLSDEGGEDWKYGFASSDDATLLRDGDSFRVGNVRFDVIHTPGHTPEHICFLVTDTAAADLPIGLLSGDFVFVGDVGRPDLLEKAAGVAGAMDAGARSLFGSIGKFREQPDYLQLWPGHGAGSACGKGLSAVPHSTVGYERLVNPMLAFQREDEFVDAVLEGQPEPPRYFATMKRINRDGPPLLGKLPDPRRLTSDRLGSVVDRQALVVDTRSAERFADGHVPGTINIPFDRSFTTWAGWLIPYDREFYLIADGDNSLAQTIAADLSMIGLDELAGYFGADAVEAWAAGGRQLQTIEQIDSGELEKRIADGSVHALDVRGRSEWEAGHIEGVQNIPVGHIPDEVDRIPRDRPLVVHCQAGARSSIAASVLQAAGFVDVLNLSGGYADWVSQNRKSPR